MKGETSEKGSQSPIRRALDKLQEVVGGMAGRMAAMTTDASNFAERALMSDRYEIEASMIAARRTRSPGILEIARTMIADHTASSHHLRAALEMRETRGVTAPAFSLDARHRSMIAHLEAADDDKFDTVYLEQQVVAHEEALTLLVNYREKGDNPQLRSCAAGMAPVVYRHLQHVKASRQGH